MLDVDALGKAEGESWVYKGRDVFEDDTRVLLHLSRGGADATVVREFNLESKSFVDPESGGFYLPEAKTRASWKDKDTLLVGTDTGEGSLTDSGYPRTVRELKRGMALADSTLQYEGKKEDVSVNGYVSKHRGVVVEWQSRSVSFYLSKRRFRMLDDDSVPTTDWIELDGVIPDDAR